MFSPKTPQNTPQVTKKAKCEPPDRHPIQRSVAQDQKCPAWPKKYMGEKKQIGQKRPNLGKKT